MTLRIVNATKSAVLATCANVPKTLSARAVGLIGVTCLDPGEGLFIPHCNAIHTKGMSISIDVIFIDLITRTISKTAIGLGPDCFYAVTTPRELSAALELPAGTIAQTGSAVGDVLLLMSSGHASQEELDEIGSL
jgi:uncharacterized membrane protein (UPF0127 family)